MTNLALGINILTRGRRISFVAIARRLRSPRNEFSSTPLGFSSSSQRIREHMSGQGRAAEEGMQSHAHVVSAEIGPCAPVKC